MERISTQCRREVLLQALIDRERSLPRCPAHSPRELHHVSLLVPSCSALPARMSGRPETPRVSAGRAAGVFGDRGQRSYQERFRAGARLRRPTRCRLRMGSTLCPRIGGRNFFVLPLSRNGPRLVVKSVGVRRDRHPGPAGGGAGPGPVWGASPPGQSGEEIARFRDSLSPPLPLWGVGCGG